jgi:hypothetical protein
MVAKFAAPPLYVYLYDEKPLSLYDHFFTIRTVGVITRMARYISDIGIMNASAKGRIAGAFQGRYGRGREIEQLIVRMKTGEVDRDVRTAFSQYPVCQLQEHLVGIV